MPEEVKALIEKIKHNRITFEESIFLNGMLIAIIEKTKCCHSCQSHKLNNLKNCQTCDGNYSKWELAK